MELIYGRLSIFPWEQSDYAQKRKCEGGGLNVLEGYLRGSKVNELEGHYPANNWTFSERCKNVPSTFCGCSVKNVLLWKVLDNNKTSQMHV